MRLPLLLIGTRPSYIKQWPVYQAFKNHNIEPIVLSTGQHIELLNQQRSILYMPIHHQLLCEQHEFSLEELFLQIYSKSIMFLSDHKREIETVFVVGDTSSAAAMALAAFHMKIPVAHVEAGLRTGNINSPYPEELNRILIDHVSTYLFCPCDKAYYNILLLKPLAHHRVTGNTVIDSLRCALRTLPPLEKQSSNDIIFEMHRRETSATLLAEIIKVVSDEALNFNCHITWPAHPRLNTKQIMDELRLTNVSIIAPLHYRSYIDLMRSSRLILTDSGGTCEEACTLGVPTIQVRDETDRWEAIDAGFSWLGSRDPDRLRTVLRVALENDIRPRLVRRHNPYGDGYAAEKIVDYYLSQQKYAENKKCLV